MNPQASATEIQVLYMQKPKALNMNDFAVLLQTGVQS